MEQKKLEKGMLRVTMALEARSAAEQTDWFDMAVKTLK